jgi:hypothetical protein
MSEHLGAALAWVARQDGQRSFSRLAAIETPDRAGVVTLNSDTGAAVVWSVGYASRKVNGCYRRLKPRRVREVTVPGETWRERRDAAKELRVSGERV